MLNRYPVWKYLLLIALILVGLLYAAPNLFGADPVVQISAKNSATIQPQTVVRVQTLLAQQHIPYLSLQQEKGSLFVRFATPESQLSARDAIKAFLGDDYIVAINLMPRTPAWLQDLGANPMKLGLDLRGGVNFLLSVDTNAVIKARQEADVTNMAAELRQENIRYAGVVRNVGEQIGKPAIAFRDADSQAKAKDRLSSHFPDYTFTTVESEGQFYLIPAMTPLAQTNLTNYAVDQNITILSNRVNELGVSEAVVQRQGQNQISVDLPGIQDTTRAKDLIGKVATLRFQLVDMEGNVQAAVAGSVPLGDRLYYYENMPVLLKNQVVLTGGSITYATAGIGENGRPNVNIRLGGGGESLFSRITAENVGKSLAVVYVESTPQTTIVNGKPQVIQKQSERVINVAEIKGPLGNNFEISNLSDSNYAQNLALLLRSGALVAPVAVIQERTVGPTLGAANIQKGLLSLVIGTLAVMVFMICYYHLFGLIADLALLLNIVFIVALLSILGGTLTLPGIAGIVLTVGISVDANVLINERIREELRLGSSPQASIFTGYDRAFATIIDANVTTLIVTLILFALGSGVVKSFAITLTLGILTSLVTAIFFTRALVNLIYGSRSVKRLSIGMKIKG